MTQYNVSRGIKVFGQAGLDTVKNRNKNSQQYGNVHQGTRVYFTGKIINHWSTSFSHKKMDEEKLKKEAACTKNTIIWTQIRNNPPNSISGGTYSIMCYKYYEGKKINSRFYPRSIYASRHVIGWGKHKTRVLNYIIFCESLPKTESKIPNNR